MAGSSHLRHQSGGMQNRGRRSGTLPQVWDEARKNIRTSGMAWNKWGDIGTKLQAPVEPKQADCLEVKLGQRARVQSVKNKRMWG